LSTRARTCYQDSMHLRVFLFANPFRWRSRRTGTYDVWKHESCIKLKCRDALWRWNTLKRRPQHYTLGFYTKVQVWGRMVRTSPHVPSTPKVTLVNKKNDDDSSILLKKEREKKIWYIYEKGKKRELKKREKKKMIYKKKRKKRSHKMGTPILDLCHYPQGPWSMHTICVCGLGLVTRLRRTMCDQVTAAAVSNIIHICCR